MTPASTMTPTHIDIKPEAFTITFESDFSLITYKGKWRTFIGSMWKSSNGRDYEEEFNAVEFFITGVYDENEKQLYTYPNLEGEIHDLLMEHTNENTND